MRTVCGARAGNTAEAVSCARPPRERVRVCRTVCAPGLSLIRRALEMEIRRSLELPAVKSPSMARRIVPGGDLAMLSMARV